MHASMGHIISADLESKAIVYRSTIWAANWSNTAPRPGLIEVGSSVFIIIPMGPILWCSEKSLSRFLIVKI